MEKWRSSTIWNETILKGLLEKKNSRSYVITTSVTTKFKLYVKQPNYLLSPPMNCSKWACETQQGLGELFFLLSEARLSKTDHLSNHLWFLLTFLKPWFLLLLLFSSLLVSPCCQLKSHWGCGGGETNILEKLPFFVETGGENTFKGKNTEQMQLCFYYCLMFFFP